MKDRSKLMREIQEYSFAVVEAVLYLDTHPRDTDAINYYNRYNSMYHEAVDEYERCYGPVTMYSGDVSDSWKWSKEPWPWEYDGGCR